MKLDKKTLKALIVESLEEMHGGEHTGTMHPDVRAGMESEPTPEELAPLDVAAYFKQVGDELQGRIESLKSAPKFEMPPAMTPEDVKEALNEMDRVQKELEEIKRTLEKLQKREEQA
jgi:hypothetical protein